MPKGALLHAHLDGMVNPQFLLKLAMMHDAFHVKAAQPVNIDTIKNTLPVFRPLPLSEFTEGTSLTSSDYQPDSWVSLRKARETFAPKLGGPEGFDRWVISALTINPNEAYKTHNTVTKV
jgi:adenosine deaminase CECR1